MKAGVALVDVLTAKDATIGVLAALNARNDSGRGAHVEVNLLSSLQGALANQGQAYLGAGKVASRMGNEHPSIVPYQLLACADGSVAVACGNDGQFARLCAEIGESQLSSDARFATNSARVANREVLIPLLEDALGADTGANWQSRFTGIGVPAGKVAGIDEGLAYAQSLGLEPVIEVHNAEGVAVGKQVRHPITWTPELDAPTVAPPQLGEHTEGIRAWLGSTTGPVPGSLDLAQLNP